MVATVRRASNATPATEPARVCPAVPANAAAPMDAETLVQALVRDQRPATITTAVRRPLSADLVRTVATLPTLATLRSAAAAVRRGRPAIQMALVNAFWACQRRGAVASAGISNLGAQAAGLPI